VSNPSKELLLEGCIKIADQAGQVIMEIYESCDIGTSYKDDNSPLTKADLEAHNVIVKGLEELAPEIPIISEEGDQSQKVTSPLFWLVDPLDGTKEFISRNGEFTTNIALIEDGLPVMGVVLAPAKNAMYVGGKGLTARKRDAEGTWKEINVAHAPSADDKVRIVASRSHGSDLLDVWLKDNFAEERVELRAAGSSLKICLVAEGEADFYPRFGRTMEWDISAGQAVLMSAGGCVTVYDESRDTNLQPLTYAKEGRDNPHFIASSAALSQMLS